jgi:hypothetical protein
MSKRFIVLRHVGSNKHAALDCAVQIARLPFIPGRKIKLLASNQTEADITVRAIETALKINAVRTPYLAGAPAPQDCARFVNHVAHDTEPIMIVVTHTDYATRLPSALANHFNLATVPPVKERKAGEYALLKIPGNKIQAKENELIAATLDS